MWGDGGETYELVRVEVDAAVLARGLLDQSDALVQLAQRVVASTTIGKDLDAVEAHVDVGAVGGEELLARLGGQTGVDGGQHDIADGDVAAALVLLDVRRQVVLLDVAGAVPGGEEAHLAKVAVVGEVDLGAQAQDLAVEHDGARIVAAVAVQHRQADVDDDAVEVRVREDGEERVPRVLVHLGLEEVVQAAVAGDLELRADAEGGAGLLGLDDALLDAPEVALKVEGPLVQRASREGHEGRHRVPPSEMERGRGREGLLR